MHPQLAQQHLHGDQVVQAARAVGGRAPRAVRQRVRQVRRGRLLIRQLSNPRFMSKKLYHQLPYYHHNLFIRFSTCKIKVAIKLYHFGVTAHRQAYAHGGARGHPMRTGFRVVALRSTQGVCRMHTVRARALTGAVPDHDWDAPLPAAGSLLCRSTPFGTPLFAQARVMSLS